MIRHTGRWNVMLGGAVFALTMLPVARAWAGVEYVTSTTDCTVHIAGSGDALTVMAGPSMRFEVWGNSVDLTNPSTGFTFSGPSGMTASIVTRHSGADNSGRGCGFVGSAVVQVSTPTTLTANAAASVSFKMPLGDLSTLSMTIVPHPALSQAVWTTNGSLQPSTMPCIIRDGFDQHDQPGHQARDPTSAGRGAGSDDVHEQRDRICACGRRRRRTVPMSRPGIKYNVTGLPSFASVSQDPSSANPIVGAQLTFTFNVSGIRHLTAANNSTITIADPIATNRTTTLTLQVTPTPGQGFSQVAAANPSSTTAGNPIDFTVKLSAPARGADHHLANDAGSLLQAGGGGGTVYRLGAVPVL